MHLLATHRGTVLPMDQPEYGINVPNGAREQLTDDGRRSLAMDVFHGIFSKTTVADAAHVQSIVLKEAGFSSASHEPQAGLPGASQGPQAGLPSASQGPQVVLSSASQGPQAGLPSAPPGPEVGQSREPTELRPTVRLQEFAAESRGSRHAHDGAKDSPEGADDEHGGDDEDEGDGALAGLVVASVFAAVFVICCVFVIYGWLHTVPEHDPPEQSHEEFHEAWIRRADKKLATAHPPGGTDGLKDFLVRADVQSSPGAQPQ